MATSGFGYPEYWVWMAGDYYGSPVNMNDYSTHAMKMHHVDTGIEVPFTYYSYENNLTIYYCDVSAYYTGEPSPNPARVDGSISTNNGLDHYSVAYMYSGTWHDYVTPGRYNVFVVNAYVKYATCYTYLQKVDPTTQSTISTSTIYEVYNRGWSTNSPIDASTTSDIGFISSVTMPTYTNYDCTGFWDAKTGGNLVIPPSGDLSNVSTTMFVPGSTGIGYNNLYTQWSLIHSDWYWYSQAQDPTKILAGEPTTNAPASRFYNGTTGLQDDIKQYVNPSYVPITTLVSGSAMKASDFNHASSELGMSAVTAGTVIQAQKFIDIRDALNNHFNS